MSARETAKKAAKAIEVAVQESKVHAESIRRAAKAGRVNKSGNLVLENLQSHLRKKMGHKIKVNGILGPRIDTINQMGVLPTSIPTLNIMLRGGWPLGRSVEIFGSEGSGKSGLCGNGIEAAQRQGGFGVWVDAEGTVDFRIWPDMDPQRLLYEDDLPTIEATWDYLFGLMDYLRSDKGQGAGPVFGAWDSVAASITQEEKKRKKMQDIARPGELARAMTPGARKAYQEIRKVPMVLAYVNHEKVAMGGLNGYAAALEPNTPGGKAIKFQTSLRIRTMKGKVDKLKRGDRQLPLGFTVWLTLFKAKTALPGDRTLCYLDYARGFDPVMSAVLAMTKWGGIKKRKRAYYVDGDQEKVGMTLDAMRDRYETEPTFRDALHTTLDKMHHLKLKSQQDAEDEDLDDDDDDARKVEDPDDGGE